VPPREQYEGAPAVSASTAQTDRLSAARRLLDENRHVDALPHYEALIDKSDSLPEVIGDLQNVVTAIPEEPRARRMLGDAHLRQGNLQAALDAYRSALDQL
jgi:hypothetical protein